MGGGFVEVTDLTQLFEERGASARRTAGGRGAATGARPAGRMPTPRPGSASPRGPRLPIV